VGSQTFTFGKSLAVIHEEHLEGNVEQKETWSNKIIPGPLLSPSNQTRREVRLNMLARIPFIKPIAFFGWVPFL